MAERFDFVILGSGSTAFAAALAAQAMGKTAVMTEQRTVGGTCVNRGCLPSKNLIEAAKLFYEARHPRYPGLNGGEMALDFAFLIAQKDTVIHDYREKKYESLVGGRIQKGPVESVDLHTVAVDGKELVGEKVLITTGRRPNTATIALERAGVTVNTRGEAEVDAFLRTTAPHIFAAGGVIGRETDSQMATPVGSRDGGIIAAISRFKDPGKLSCCAE